MIGTPGSAGALFRRMPRAVVSRETANVLEGLDIPALDTSLGFRVAYQEALVAGLGPSTYDPKSAAATEVRELTSEVLAVVGAPSLEVVHG